MNNIFFSFLLTIIAGLSTLLGYTIIFFRSVNYNKLIACSLAFASGVMICISITDLIPESINLFNFDNGFDVIFFCFFSILIGIFLSLLIDKITNISNTMDDNKLYQIGIISMIAIIIHNIPEGIITFLSSTSNTSLGVKLAIAISIHNIPEGISISVPIFFACNNKKVAFKYTLISALSEPFGALMAYVFLYKYINNLMLALILGIIAGIMLSISILELLPKSFEYKYHKISFLSFIFGIFLMLINIFF